MLLHFRQGIVEAQIPTFIQVTYPHVDLLVTDTNCTIAFAAGQKDYLFTEQQAVAKAWGPLYLGIDQWLYWDLDIRTGNRTFGITKVAPINSPTQPASPAMDQHWFNTLTNEMKVWTGAAWVKRIRAFACKLAQGRIPVSMSANAPLFTGTQVGNNTTTYVGHILYDATTGNAIRDASGNFMTTEDNLSTKTISLSQVKVASIIVEGVAQQNMAAHTIVRFTDFGKIVHADQFIANQPIQYGIIEQSVTVGQTVNVVTNGMVSSESFDFTDVGVNALLYCDAAGQLVSDPVIPGQVPVAVVVDRKTIQLGVALASNNETIPEVNLATNLAFGISRLSVPAEDESDPIVVGDNDPRWDSFVHKAGDTMSGPLILNGVPTLDLHAATKKYVDDSCSHSDYYSTYFNIMDAPTFDIGEGETAWTIDPRNGFIQYAGMTLDGTTVTPPSDFRFAFVKGLPTGRVWRVRVHVYVDNTLQFNNAFVDTNNADQLLVAYGTLQSIGAGSCSQMEDADLYGGLSHLYEFFTYNGGNIWYWTKLVGFQACG